MSHKRAGTEPGTASLDNLMKRLRRICPLGIRKFIVHLTRQMQRCLMLLTRTAARPPIDTPPHLDLSSEERAVLETMFAGYQRVTIQGEFGGGLGGGRVFAVVPIRREESPELPAAVKVAPAGLIQKEWQAYRSHVHLRLPGTAEIIGKPVLLPGNPLGGLRYALAGQGGTFEVQSLHAYYGRATAADVLHVLKKQLFKIVAKWLLFNQAVPSWPTRALYDLVLPVNLWIEPAPLLPSTSSHRLKPGKLLSQPLSVGDYVRLEGFVIAEVDRQQKTITLNVPPRKNGFPASYRLRLQPVEPIDAYRANHKMPSVTGRVTRTRSDYLQDIVQEVLGDRFDRTVDALVLSDGTTLPEPLHALPDLLSKTRNVKISCVHGDLNLENILVEPGSRSVSLIDFATARRDHALHDLLRLETEVVTKLLPQALPEDSPLAEAIDDFYRQLHKATFAPQAPGPAQPLPADLEKPLAMLAAVRAMARQCLFDANDWTEYYEGLTLYLLGALKFKNLDRLSREVAFWAAAVACNLASPAPLKSLPMARDWERLQEYLPAEMCQQREEAACLDHLNALLRAVSTYLPRHLALQLLREPALPRNQGQFLEGTLLFADISGFTELSEKLQQERDREGAEKITALINAYLDVMLPILFKHNGRLIKFGGDAMLCLFTGPDRGAMDAVWTAWEMRQAMAERFAEVEVLQEIYPLAMKAGSNSGLLFAATVGTAEHMEYVLTGSAVERAARAESAAGRGDILISAETYDLVQDDLEAVPLADAPDFYRVLAIRSQPLSESADPWDEIEERLALIAGDLWAVVDRLDALSPYLSAGILSQLAHDPQEGKIEGERRQVTVLFANFVGMDAIIRARGVQNAAAIAADLGEYLAAVQEEVAYYGGVVNKVDLYDQGDKLMVLFGAPRAHENDARRAALTALAMQEAVRKLPSPIASTLLCQCIGIHSGFAFAGNVGSDRCHRREYTVMGDTVNLAARLMSATPRGATWISQHVWDQIQGEFEATALPPIQVQGIREPIAAYELRAARGVQEGRRWSRVLDSEMVGRERELGALQERFADLISGSGKQIVAVTGEVGVGKTRLIAEWQRQVSESTRQRTAGEAVVWLTGRGHSYGQRTHGVWIEILEGLLGFAQDDGPEERWEKLSARVLETFAGAAPGWDDMFLNRLACLGQFLGLDLSKKRGLSARRAQLEGASVQAQTHLAICDLLTHAAHERPLALVLEDLHWADDASLELLCFVLDRVSDRAPILFFLIYRPLRELPIWQRWQEIVRVHPSCCEIALEELSDKAVRQLLFNLLKNARLPKAFQALVLEQADGNPLYVEEILHALIEEGAIVRSQEGWQIAQDVARIRVPKALHQIIQSRVDELDMGSPGARRVLWMASVIGEAVPENLLEHMFISTGRDEEELSRHLRELQNAAMIMRSKVQQDGHTQWGYRFQHGLIQQVAYENMPAKNRRAYHRQVGGWMEEQYSDDLARHSGTLAHHYDRGQAWRKAFQYCRLAGDRDAHVFANREAVSHLRRALEIAGHANASADVLGQIHFELGKVLVVMGAFDDARAHLAQAWDRFGNAPGQAGALLGARVAYEIGRLHVRVGGRENLEEALEWQRKGRALLPERPTSEAVLLHLLGGAVGARQNDYARVDRECGPALELAQEIGARPEQGLAHRLMTLSARNRGYLDRAMTHCQEDIAICRELSDVIGLAKGYANQGMVAFEMGDWLLAEASYLQALALQEGIGDRFQAAITKGNLGDLYRHRGDLERGLDYAQSSRQAFDELEAYDGAIFARAVLATLFWQQGDLKEAWIQLVEARRLIKEHGAAEFEATVGRWLAQVYLAEKDAGRAQAELEALRSFTAEELGVDAEPIQRLRGQVLAAQGREDEAVQTLEGSLARLEEGQMPYQTACAWLALAGVLARMEGQRAAAREHARRARATFAELGARPDVQRAYALVAELGE